VKDLQLTNYLFFFITVSLIFIKIFISAFKKIMLDNNINVEIKRKWKI